MEHPGLWGLSVIWCCFCILGSGLPLFAQGPYQDRHIRRYNPGPHLRDAEAQLLDIWRLDPKDEAVVHSLGKFYYWGLKQGHLKDYDKAIAWYREAIELDPTSRSAQYASHFLSEVYILQGNRPKAIRLFEGLLEYSQEADREVAYLRQLIKLYRAAEDFEMALKHARRWGELEPDDPKIQDRIDRLTLKKREGERLLARREKILESEPLACEELQGVADALRELGYTQKAFDLYTKLNVHTPGNFLYLDRLLDLGTRLEKPDRFRMRILESMLSIQPNNLRVIEQLAEETGSIDLIDRGLELHPENGHLLLLKDKYEFNRAISEGTLFF